MSKLIPKHQTPSQPLVLLPDNTRVESPYVERIPITETNLYKQYLADPYKNSDFNTWKQRQELIQSNKKDEKVKADKRAPIVKKQESEQGKAIYNQQQRKEQEAKNNKLIWTGIGLGGLALAQTTPAAPFIDAAFATHGALGLAKQADEGTLGLNLETGLHALEMLPFGIRGVGKAIKYADDVAREAYAPYDFYRTIKETTPNIKGMPYNVGWGPKQTIKVVHATDSQDPLRLFFDKRWDVTTEGANPFGVWYLGKWGLPRTAATNSLPGKAEKAARARKLFENRKYKHLGEVTLEKPLITVGDVPDRSALSHTAEKMGADGLIYNNVYDNGFDNNLVILSFKTPEKTSINITKENAHKLSDQEWDQIYEAALNEGNAEKLKELRALHFQVKSGNDSQVFAHSTNNTFNQFDKSFFGLTDEGFNGRGFYFTTTRIPENQSIYKIAKGPNGEIPYMNYGRNKKYFYLKGDREYNVGDPSRNFFEESNTVGFVSPKDSKVSEVVVGLPALIKNTRAITYDDNGNFIPLSKRDDFTNPDFRYKNGAKILIKKKR